MGIFDPETGLRYCEKHSWEQADDCLYCANESLRKEVERLRKYRDMDKRVESMQIGVDEVCRLRDTIRTLEEQLAAKDETILQQAKDITEMDAALEERNNVMHRAVEDADTLRKEVERLMARVRELEEKYSVEAVNRNYETYRKRIRELESLVGWR